MSDEEDAAEAVGFVERCFAPTSSARVWGFFFFFVVVEDKRDKIQNAQSLN